MTAVESAPDARSHARLIVASSKESGAWLQALPLSSLCLRMDDSTIHVAMGLSLGSSLCTCHDRGAKVDRIVTHGLSGVRVAINDIVHRALSSAKVPSHLEPAGLYLFDGKRPNSITMVLWERENTLAWDAMCLYTFAPSYTSSASRGENLCHPYGYLFEEPQPLYHPGHRGGEIPILLCLEGVHEKRKKKCHFHNGYHRKVGSIDLDEFLE